jgi:hypothetical protein
MARGDGKEVEDGICVSVQAHKRFGVFESEGRETSLSFTGHFLRPICLSNRVYTHTSTWLETYHSYFYYQSTKLSSLSSITLASTLIS